MISRLVLALLLLAAPCEAVTFTVLTQGSATGGSPVTASITPTSGQTALVFASNNQANPVTVTGTNGWNVTWTRTVAERTTGGSPSCLIGVYRGIPSSGVAGTLTLSTPGPGFQQNGWVIVQLGGVNTTAGSQGIVQSAAAGPTAGTSLAVSLSAFANSINATFHTSAQCFNETVSAQSGWTTTAQTNGAGVTLSFGANFKNSPDTSPNGNTFANSHNVAAIAGEIASPTSGPKHKILFHSPLYPFFAKLLDWLML